MTEFFAHSQKSTKKLKKSSAEDESTRKLHFLNNLSSAGRAFRHWLSERYFSIVGMLMAREVTNGQDTSIVTEPRLLATPSGSNRPSRLRLHLFDICALDFAPSDLPHLQSIGIVQFVSPLIAFVGTNASLLDDREIEGLLEFDEMRSDCRVRQRELT